LGSEIKKGDGKTELATSSGGKLTFMKKNGPHNISIVDGGSHISNISTYDVNQSNGVIIVIDTVLLPNQSNRAVIAT